MRVPSRNHLVRAATLLSAVLSAAVLAGPDAAVHDDGAFELDRNAADGDAASPSADDWDPILRGDPSDGGPGVKLLQTSTGNVPGWPHVVSDPVGQSIYDQSGAKDTNDVSSWSAKTGSAPDKDELTNAYTAAYDVNGHLVIYFGSDRLAQTGSSAVGFWFFQDDVKLLSNGHFSGHHVKGDILVTSDFSNGGAVSTVRVFEWVGPPGTKALKTLFESSGGTNDCSANPADDRVCATVNQTETPAPWPYTAKGGVPGVFPPFAFLEGAFDVSGFFGANELPCFASFLAMSRSSTTVNSQLKDFVTGSFPVFGIALQTACTATEVNASEDGFVAKFNGSVTNTGFGQIYDAQVVSDAGTPADPSDDVVIQVGNVAPGKSAAFGPLSVATHDNPATLGASVSAALASGGDPTLSETADAAICPKVTRTPELSLTKNCSTRLVEANGRVSVELEFWGQVCNQGDIGVDAVTLSDDQGPIDEPLVGSLEVGECASYRGHYLPSTLNNTPPSDCHCAGGADASFKDTATATGIGRLGFEVLGADATATCGVCPKTAP